MPLTAHEGGVRTEDLYLYIPEFELAHLPAALLVALAIALQCRVPALRACAAGEEDQVGRLPIACHEAFEVALIPRGDLLVEHLANGDFGLRRGGFPGVQRRKKGEQTGTKPKQSSGCHGRSSLQGRQHTPGRVPRDW